MEQKSTTHNGTWQHKYKIKCVQQEHPLDWVWDWAFPDEDFKFTSTRSSCFAEDSVSIPGNAAAIFRKRACKDVQKSIRTK